MLLKRILQPGIHSIGLILDKVISPRDTTIKISFYFQLVFKAVKLRKFFSFLVFLFIPTELLANDNIRLDQVSLDEGLSQGEVRVLLQDSDGYLWIGTQQGLNLYDGHRVRTISGPDNLLEIQRIDSIYQDKQNNIWIGSVPNRNFLIDKSNNQITEISPPFPETRDTQDSAIFEATEDSDDTLWVSSLRALFRKNKQDNQLTMVADFQPTLSTQELIRELLSFENFILVATSNGLFAVNKKSSRILPIPYVEQLKSPPLPVSDGRDDRINVKGLAINQAGNLLLATVEGLYELDSRSLSLFLKGQSTTISLKVLEPELNIWHFIEESTFYWLATNEGLFRLDKNGTKQFVLAYSKTRFNSADDNIISMIKDDEGNLWLGSRNDGAFKWTPNLGRFTYYQQSSNSPKAISNNRVWSTAEDKQGNIWVGTRNGLNRINRNTGDVSQLLINPDKKATVSESTFFDMEVQGDNLWLASVGGIRKLDISTQQENTPILSPEAKEVFTKTPNDIFFLDENRMGIIHPEGIYTFDTSSGEIIFNENTKNDGKIQNQLFNVIGEDPHDQDKLLVTMVDQVVSLSKSDTSYQVVHALPPSDKPRTTAQDVYIDELHTWIAYPGFGIYIIDNKTGEEVKHLTSLDGLPDNSPLDFKADHQGNLWVTSNSGLIRFNKETFHFRVYDTNDGLSTNEFNGGASLVTRSGEFFFGSIKGVMQVTPSSLIPGGESRQLDNHITKISLMSRALPQSFSPLSTSELDISHKDYGLKLEFSALSFTSPKKLKYKYWLEGSSKTSPAITNESELFLPKLEPGNSIFKVAVIDYETGEESEPAQLYLNVSPHPAFSWWAYTIYAVFLSSVTFAIYWQRRKRQVALLNAHNVLKTNEERLQLALTGGDSGLWDWQAKDDKVFESKQDQSDLRQGDYYSFANRLEKIHPNDRDVYRQKWSAFINGQDKVFDYVYRWKKKDDQWSWYRDLARITEVDSGGTPTRVTGTYTDITQSKDDRDKVKLFSEAFQSTRDIIIITDNNLQVSAANTALYRATQFEEEKVIGYSLPFLLAPDSKTLLADNIMHELNTLGHWEGEGNLQRLYQLPLPVLVSVNSFNNELGDKRFVFALTDIQEQKQAEDELRKLANYDPLTGLPNRALLMDRISHALASARRNQTQVALFFIDLDRFKQINDSLGHDVGDLLLTNVAKVLQQCTRKSDTVARLGGDEFVVMLENVANVEAISRIAQSIIDRMTRPFQLGIHEVSASPSIGISIYPEDGETSDELFKHSDMAMYHAKDAGRNNFKFFTSELNDTAQHRLKLESELRAAIKNNEFILHYQPKISLDNNEITGFECLARWQKPNGELIPPFDFIPLAEELGLIINITEQLITQAMHAMQSWMEQDIHTRFALNLSAKHLRHYDLTQFVAAQLNAFKIPASTIEFELTESTIMDDMARAVELLNNLNEQGIAIALDDFGTGYTSFQYLKDFPINALKIDRSFVKDIGKDSKDEAIIEAIIALASKLGIDTIAEGVETYEQAEYLRHKGCPFAQGYLYSKPVPVEEALLLAMKKHL